MPSSSTYLPKPVSILLGVAFWLSCSVSPHAGGGPETTLVVVNAGSTLSQRLANEYVALRDIPMTHLLWLDELPTKNPISLQAYKEKILRPIVDHIQEQGLDEEIDLIAYSADFPYAVDFSADLKANDFKRNRHLGTHASLTGLTFFARRVLAGDLGYFGKNHYFRDFAGPEIRTGLRQTTSSATELKQAETKLIKRRAKAAMQGGDYATALEAYRRLRDNFPDEQRHWFDLARSLAAAGRYASAMATLSELVDRGWTHSLLTANDSHLQPLHSEPQFQLLLERMANAYGPFMLSHGFRNEYAWSNSDLWVWEPEDHLDRYYLSVMLAYTGARGNSFAETMAYLNAARSSDGVHPDGTVYLMENPNVRSVVRQPLFPTTVTELHRRGRKAEILTRGRDRQNGRVPKDKQDVIGLVAGYPKYRWSKSGSRLLPGAIAETLTSYGGHFDKRIQTKLTEYLRYGAAGSSGAVAEPFAMQEKFPVPLLHVYYADGCSLAEAFYQSVAYPYQLIIVGDPLARPFADFVDIGLKSPSASRTWSGKVAVESEIRGKTGTGVKQVELWIDGQRVGEASLGVPIVWDSRSVDDGAHDLRLVAIEDSLIETRSYRRYPIRVSNTGLRLEIGSVSESPVYGDELLLEGAAPAADRVTVYHGLREIAATATTGGRWRLAVDSTKLGIGPVTLFVRAVKQDAGAVRSNPISLVVKPPVPIDRGAALEARTREQGRMAHTPERG